MQKVTLARILERAQIELPEATRQIQPLRFIVDTSKGQPEVLRLLQAAVLLEIAQGLRLEAAAVATQEQLDEALKEFPNQDSRLLFESRVAAYVPGDPERTYEKAMERARRAVPNLHPEGIISKINSLTVGWFLETIEILGVWNLSQGLKDQINFYLTAA
ncbi:MAG: hypothetical protein HY211_00850 [Candidatus Omnitrophica bacterium]|nr:hypothetical protein [Candidatus Omnitrophota bacterium]